MKKLVYLDSIIISYLFDERKSMKLHIDVTQRWWEEERKNYDIWISEETITELNQGDYPNKINIIERVILRTTRSLKESLIEI